MSEFREFNLPKASGPVLDNNFSIIPRDSLEDITEEKKDQF